MSDTVHPLETLDVPHPHSESKPYQAVLIMVGSCTLVSTNTESTAMLMALQGCTEAQQCQHDPHTDNAAMQTSGFTTLLQHVGMLMLMGMS